MRKLQQLQEDFLFSTYEDFHDIKSDLDDKLHQLQQKPMCCLLHEWPKEILHLFTQISKYVSPQCDIFNNAKLTEPQGILM